MRTLAVAMLLPVGLVGGPARGEPVPSRHVVRVYVQSSFPVPELRPDSGLGVAYSWSPFPRLALEGSFGWAFGGPELGVMAKLRYGSARQMFVGLGEVVLLAPAGVTHDAFAPYPGYLLVTDLLGWEWRERANTLITVSVGTVTILHSFDEPGLQGWTGPRVNVGVGRWF